MKYVLYIDYRSNASKAYEYRAMEAKNFKEAINEAEKIYNPDTMYLIRIMEKEGKIYTGEGCRNQNYRAIECKRSCKGGWHANSSENSEEDHVVRRSYMKFNGKIIDWYELV